MLDRCSGVRGGLAQFVSPLLLVLSCSQDPEDQSLPVGGAPSGGRASATGAGGASTARGGVPGNGGVSATFGGAAGSGGASSYGGAPANGGASSYGGAPANGGARSNGGVAGGGQSSGTGGAQNGGSSSAAKGGATSGTGVGYTKECHGDSRECNDAALRCLGIRDSAGVVAGYACSNQCMSSSDCRAPDGSTAATPDCIEFVGSKHCLLVCNRNGALAACPAGMGCYVYPGTALGYCLWM
ncbi:MAG: hypothetical protein ACOY0T_18270 [Myxococcota bacterium]